MRDLRASRSGSHPERLPCPRQAQSCPGRCWCFPLLLFLQQTFVGIHSLMIFSSCICIFAPGIMLSTWSEVKRRPSSQLFQPRVQKAPLLSPHPHSLTL